MRSSRPLHTPTQTNTPREGSTDIHLGLIRLFVCCSSFRAIRTRKDRAAQQSTNRGSAQRLSCFSLRAGLTGARCDPNKQRQCLYSTTSRDRVPRIAPPVMQKSFFVFFGLEDEGRCVCGCMCVCVCVWGGGVLDQVVPHRLAELHTQVTMA